MLRYKLRGWAGLQGDGKHIRRTGASGGMVREGKKGKFVGVVCVFHTRVLCTYCVTFIVITNIMVIQFPLSIIMSL